MAEYRKKVPTFVAIQWTGDNEIEILREFKGFILAGRDGHPSVAKIMKGWYSLTPLLDQHWLVKSGEDFLGMVDNDSFLSEFEPIESPEGHH